ncbi:MAG: adenylate/guanylate cyclase domain-containing protein [Treponema sp.]|jgi:class 3 adenylate cyclase/HAMP domain-containing protein|nr:adenylate/guanylate cyclase domain-containing protein [Treponema sp.]
MKIRVKIFLVVLPLIIVTLCLAETASYFYAVNGINRISRSFFSFKTGELEKYALSQWMLLVENNYAGRPDMVEAAKEAVNAYAKSIVSENSELIFAVDEEGNYVFGTGDPGIRDDERGVLLSLLVEENAGVQTCSMGGIDRVFQFFYFTPFSLYFILSEDRAVFYQDAEKITFMTIVTIGAASAAALILLIILSRFLTRPLARMVTAMNTIIEGGDLSSRVEVEYQDETGNLAGTFNLMIEELDKAYRQIKRYAFEAALKGKEEQRIRRIFQKYVPNDIINRFIANPAAMYKGENRVLAILFSDIRGFTTISEGMKDPADLVDSLNRYFSGQVDIIYNRRGIVDKYIGDAIMAFWGAPAQHDDDALQAVLSGLDMIDALGQFNENQRRLGKPEFHIGVGINYGEVTVGNIGSERKMDYTVIGDSVNLASRMEGLTKTYHAELLITESLYGALQNTASRTAAGGPDPGAAATAEKAPAFRLLDTVAVKGKTRGVKIYTAKRTLSGAEERAWSLHNQGMELYYRRDFSGAAEKFREVLKLLPGDWNGENLCRRCISYASSPPPPDWDGVEVMHSK